MKIGNIRNWNWLLETCLGNNTAVLNAVVHCHMLKSCKLTTILHTFLAMGIHVYQLLQYKVHCVLCINFLYWNNDLWPNKTEPEATLNYTLVIPLFFLRTLQWKVMCHWYVVKTHFFNSWKINKYQFQENNKHGVV